MYFFYYLAFFTALNTYRRFIFVALELCSWFALPIANLNLCSSSTRSNLETRSNPNYPAVSRIVVSTVRTRQLRNASFFSNGQLPNILLSL